MTKITAIDVLTEAAALKKLKSEDYQSSKWEEKDYFPFDEISYIHMIHTKYLRMRNIVEGEHVSPNFEALEDTLVDMCVYSAMFAAFIINKKQEKKDKL